MPLLEESQQHALQDVKDLLVELQQQLNAHGKFLAKFGQHSLTEEAPISLDACSPQLSTWHTRPPDVNRQLRALPSGSSNSSVQPPQPKVASSTRTWRPPPSRTIGEFVPTRVRIEAPLFNGDDPLGWIFGIQDYFNYFVTDESVRLAVVENIIEQPALDWFHNYQKSDMKGSWEDFLVAVRYHFAPEVDDEERLGGSSLCAGIPNEVLDVVKPTETGDGVSDDCHTLDGKLEDARVLPMCNKHLHGATPVENSEGRENFMEVAVSNGLAASMIFEESAAMLKEDVAALVPFESEQPTGSFEIKELNELNSFLCTDRSKSYSVLEFLGINTELQPQNCNVINGKLRVLSGDIQGDFGDATGLLDRYGDARTIPPSKIPDDVVVLSVASKLVNVVSHGSDARIYIDGATPTLSYSDDMKASFCGDAKWSRASLQFGANNGVLIFDPGAFVPNDSRNPASSNFLVIICHSLTQELTLEEVVDVSILPRARIFSEYANRPFNHNSADHHFCSAPARRRFYDNLPAVRHHFHAGMRIPAQQISKLPVRPQKRWSRPSFKGHTEKKQFSITQDLEPGNVGNEDDYSPETTDDKVGTEMRMAVDLATTLVRVENKKVITSLSLLGNHIVFYSTSFLELTEDSREEFLGRNCRVMQGPATDPSRVRMARESFENNHWNSFNLHPTCDLIGRNALESVSVIGCLEDIMWTGYCKF